MIINKKNRREFMKKSIIILSMMACFVGINHNLLAHCQIPCGIYNDHLRIELMKEHVQTIKKSMNLIIELSQNTAQNMNQVVRWVNNKEDHADKLSEIVTHYFLAQRIKIKDSSNKAEFMDYQKKLTLLHQLMVFSMNSKQTTDLYIVDKLNKLITEFSKIYFTKEDIKHLHEHRKK